MGKQDGLLDGCAVDMDGTTDVTLVGFALVGATDFNGRRVGLLGDCVGRCVGINEIALVGCETAVGDLVGL